MCVGLLLSQSATDLSYSLTGFDWVGGKKQNSNKVSQLNPMTENDSVNDWMTEIQFQSMTEWVTDWVNSINEALSVPAG